MQQEDRGIAPQIEHNSAHSADRKTIDASAPKTAREARTFAFDAPYREVSFVTDPQSKRPKIVYHRINRPDRDATHTHQQSQASESVSQGPNVTAIVSAGTSPDDDLWHTLATHAKGYNFGDGAARNEWVELTDERKGMIPHTHRLQAINSYYSCKIALKQEDEDDDDEQGFRLSAAPLVFTFSIGPDDEPDYVVTWTAKRSDDAARKRFERERGTSLSIGAGKGAKTVNRLNYKAFREYLAALTEGFDNATVGGKLFQSQNSTKGRKEWLDGIDDFWALELVGAYTTAFKAAQSDSLRP